MLSSSHLISNANSTRSDIDQVIRSLSEEQGPSHTVTTSGSNPATALLVGIPREGGPDSSASHGPRHSSNTGLSPGSHEGINHSHEGFGLVPGTHTGTGIQQAGPPPGLHSDMTTGVSGMVGLIQADPIVRLLGEGGAGLGNCAVERYDDFEETKEGGLYSQLGHVGSYTHQLNSTDKDDPDSDDGPPISALWESRWLDHAALVGRFMAEDKAFADQMEKSNPYSNERRGSPAFETSPSPSSPVPLRKPRRSSSSNATPEGGHLYKCKVPDCQAAFSTPWQRSYHLLAAHQEVQLQCPECSRVFVKRQQLEVHLKSHLKLKLYKCEKEGCDKSFLTQQQCKNHTLVHSGAKEHVCPVCEKCFTEKNTLVRHSRTHTKVKLYRCEACQRSFSYASSLRVHKKQFHSRNSSSSNPSSLTTSSIDPPSRNLISSIPSCIIPPSSNPASSIPSIPPSSIPSCIMPPSSDPTSSIPSSVDPSCGDIYPNNTKTAIKSPRPSSPKVEILPI